MVAFAAALDVGFVETGLEMMFRFVGAGGRYEFGTWTELVELEENRASEDRNQNRICSPVASRELVRLFQGPTVWSG